MEIKEFGDLKISYREGTPDELVLEDSFMHNIYFLAVPEYKLKPNDIIIDIGAHIGAFSIFAAYKLKQGKVYAIEASKESFEYLKRNATLNKLSNVFISNLAITDFKGNTRLYHSLKYGNWGDTITKKCSEEYEEVKTDTLSNFIRDNNIIRCDFMKLNCEGAEFKIILSTPREILERAKIIVIQYHLDLVDGYSEKDLTKHLKECGFSTTIRNKSSMRGWIIAGKTGTFSPVMLLLNYLRVRFRMRMRSLSKQRLHST